MEEKMEKVEQIVNNLQFTQEDMNVFKSLAPIMKEHLKEAVEMAANVLTKDESVLKVMLTDGMDLPQAIDFWTKEISNLFFAESGSDDYVENLYDFLKRNKRMASIMIERGAELDLGMQIIIVLMSSMYEVLKRYVPVSAEATQIFFKVAIVMLTIFAYVYMQEKYQCQRALMKSIGISEHLLQRLISLEKNT